MIIILIPIFNDWESVGLLLKDLDTVLYAHALPAQVLLVDDGSTQPVPADFAQGGSGALKSVSILRLRRNLGHQRAIAVGLVYVYQNCPCDAVVVMDGDGEDRPQDIPQLVARCEREDASNIIFAARAKRLERPAFRALYQVYRVLHWLLTGDQVRVGNFSVVPSASLERLVVVPEIWNHYAAAVIRSRLAFQTLPIARSSRLAGKSKMNFISLLLHGLSAFFVYGEIAGARLLVAVALALTLEVALVISGILINLATHFSAWALFAWIGGVLGIILLQAIALALILVFTVIGSRVNLGFLPIRDCPYFISGVERIV